MGLSLVNGRGVRFRCFHNIRLNEHISHERLRRSCFIDYYRKIALEAETGETESGQ